ncbi:MAG: YigZ family protein [Bacillota bacterium]
MDLKIYVPKNNVEVKNKVKDSIFYGNIKSVENINEAKNFISKIKDKYYDATHNVSAYVIKDNKESIEYYDDDGEPSKSSGPPILEMIKGKNLVNTVIVVTRYFGGTQLGIGGLIRAYGNTAKKVIESAKIKTLNLYYYIKAVGNYDNIGTIFGQIEAYKGKIKDTKYYDNSIELFFYLNPKRFDQIEEKLIKETGNKVKIKIINKFYL